MEICQRTYSKIHTLLCLTVTRILWPSPGRGPGDGLRESPGRGRLDAGPCLMSECSAATAVPLALSRLSLSLTSAGQWPSQAEVLLLTILYPVSLGPVASCLSFKAGLRCFLLFLFPDKYRFGLFCNFFLRGHCAFSSCCLS